jgi:light-independent protochlorophyllide reductase subunit B
MQLTLWTYEGPPHIGAMRLATSMKDVHYVLHAPQGDTYADLLFTMIERLPRRPPVTYTTFQARDLGGDTAQLFIDAVLQAEERFKPKAMLVGASCTAELIQDDPGGLALGLQLDTPIIALELPAYQRKENWGCAESFYHLVRQLLKRQKALGLAPERNLSSQPSCNILGPTALGFRHRDDVIEIERLLGELGIQVNVIAPMNASVSDIEQLPHAHFNVVLYPETAQTVANWLMREYQQPYTQTIPIGHQGTLEFIREVLRLAQQPIDEERIAALSARSKAAWYAASVDSTYLTNKRVFVFGDASHAIAAARVASKEMGFQVVGLGSYSREFAKDVREAAALYGVDALITDDYLEVEERIEELHPELILGTQMERHIAKRQGIPCAVISAPMHVQDFPARYAPQMGFEGANVLFDTWVHPLMMGLEEHLLGMFREDFEFNDQVAPSHLGGAKRQLEGSSRQNPWAPQDSSPPPKLQGLSPASALTEGATPPFAEPESHSAKTVEDWVQIWSLEAQNELKKIPFFVRGKAKRNTEKFAKERGLLNITVETLYDAKAHFSR